MFEKVQADYEAEIAYRREQLRRALAVRRQHDRLRRRRRMGSDLSY